MLPFSERNWECFPSLLVLLGTQLTSPHRSVLGATLGMPPASGGHLEIQFLRLAIFLMF